MPAVSLGVRGLLLACHVTITLGCHHAMDINASCPVLMCTRHHPAQQQYPAVPPSSAVVPAVPPSSAAVPSCPTQLSSSTQLSHPAQQQYPAVPPSSAAVPSCPTQLSSSTQLSHPAQQQYPAVPLSSAPHPQAVQREEQGRQLVASCEAELVAVRQKLRSQLAQRPAVAGGRWAAA